MPVSTVQPSTVQTKHIHTFYIFYFINGIIDQFKRNRDALAFTDVYSSHRSSIWSQKGGVECFSIAQFKLLRRRRAPLL